MSLFSELKRRNVLRVAAAYVAVAWLVIQVTETLFPVFGFSDAAIRGVVILLAIGFLPAVISAWAFELTPQGLIRDSEVDRSSPTIKAMGKRLDRLFMVALAAVSFYYIVPPSLKTHLGLDLQGGLSVGVGRRLDGRGQDDHVHGQAQVLAQGGGLDAEHQLALLLVVDGLVAAQPDAPDMIVQGLEFLGAADARGFRQFRHQGSL